ncbi:hypothetical protein Nepgr_000698 [Nepenthes gracilis]|uniref:Phospholipid/glycerol acyltransferase domain-containing protein n=1 Tax=Nepenthes gracilis TaxID=150966 RepID=A0AAD3P3B0_NEPGR|nr:hypothetical protein Nepgr_000698 [Nepenthes gracilis]
MVLSVIISKLAEWLLYQLLANSCYKAARKLGNYYAFLFFKNPSSKSPQQIPIPPCPNVGKPHIENLSSKTVVCDMNGGILLTMGEYHPSFFPYFMLVAFEGGSIVRAFLLLLSCPLLRVLNSNHELKLRAMIFITFCGLKVKDLKNVEKAVLPKFYLENLNLEVYELLEKAKKKVVITTVPRVMVEGFAKEYLKVADVIGTELQTFGPYFTGLLATSSGLIAKHRAAEEYFGEETPDVGIGTSAPHDHRLLSLCKEVYVVPKTGGCSKVPRDRYPKPLVFHDGRLAFLPTPMATLAMFVWLPIGLLLAMFRLAAGILLPYRLAVFVGSLSGVRITFKQKPVPRTPTHHQRRSKSLKGVLYVCSHRTLLDPVMLSLSLAKPLTAVTYSLSKMSEMIAPLRTVRLTRDRKQDGETMQSLLSEGDLVVCPEGTTCREPYLLRFSSLFAELADKIVPVAMNTHVSMFYGTTARGHKCLDPIFFLMNPRPCYYVHVLEELPRDQTCAGGKSCFEVANQIQRQLAAVLGFECTGFTRKDKYMMLAGNEGLANVATTTTTSNTESKNS